MQMRRGILFIGLALVLAIAAGLTAQRWLQRQSVLASSVQAMETSPVVVARIDLGVASTLNDRELEVIQWPTAHVPKGAVGDPQAAAGRVLRRPIAAGEPVLEAALYERGTRGGLGAVITPEYRALSVKVDPVVGVAGFVQPGSRVDVLATLRRLDREQALPYSKLILQDVKVLAIDQRLEEARTGDPRPVNVVTLEVDPVQAEHLVYAAHEGRLQLALRTPGDSEKLATDMVGVADVMGIEKPRPRRVVPVSVARTGPSVEVLKGARREVRTF